MLKKNYNRKIIIMLFIVSIIIITLFFCFKDQSSGIIYHYRGENQNWKVDLFVENNDKGIFQNKIKYECVGEETRLKTSNKIIFKNYVSKNNIYARTIEQNESALEDLYID